MDTIRDDHPQHVQLPGWLTDVGPDTAEFELVGGPHDGHSIRVRRCEHGNWPAASASCHCLGYVVTATYQWRDDNRYHLVP